MTSSQVNVKKGTEQAPYMASTGAPTESVANVKMAEFSVYVRVSGSFITTHQVLIHWQNILAHTLWLNVNW